MPSMLIRSCVDVDVAGVECSVLGVSVVLLV